MRRGGEEGFTVHRLVLKTAWEIQMMITKSWGQEFGRQQTANFRSIFKKRQKNIPTVRLKQSTTYKKKKKALNTMLSRNLRGLCDSSSETSEPYSKIYILELNLNVP